MHWSVSTLQCGLRKRWRRSVSFPSRLILSRHRVLAGTKSCHEMVHGLRQIRGTTDSHTPADSPNMDTVEEFMAIVVSNVYRSELKRPGLRADHHGFAALPAAQEDPGVFLKQPAKSGESNLSRMKQFKKDNPDFFEDLKKSPARFNPFKLV